MFQNAAIDVAIGLILMYLMLSLLCTVANEFIATKLELRSSTLKDALQKLIDDPAVLANFKDHGLIASNFRAASTGSQTTWEAVKSGGASVRASLPGAPAPAAPAVAPDQETHPSYLAGGTVALALIGSLLKQGGNANATGFADVKSAIDNLPPSKIKDALQANVVQANQEIDALRQGIATWFDDSMDRLSGAYKRKMKWIGMLIGLVVAIAFNADSFKVATTLWNDADRRASAVEIATKIAKEPVPAQEQSGSQQTDTKKQDTAKKPVDLKKEIEKTEDTLRSLPIGWNCPKADGSTDYYACAGQGMRDLTIVQFLGWFLTAAALTLGAPFWFDLLDKFINLRGAGAKPAREDEKTG
jgi:hypothetical protein